ncbi:MAG: cupin, partial [Acidimicrobiia bacterium]|nr:cupin [Acidimicrobiia bacterium]
MDADLAVLARCVGDVDAFADRHWGRAPVLRRAAGAFDDLLDVDAVESLLVSSARRPTFRLVRDGGTLPPDGYTATVRLGSASVPGVADVGAIATLVGEGATVVLHSLQRTWLPLVGFCRALERATSHPVQANAYLSPGGTPGLGRHADDHDVLVLQVDGAKGWDVDGLGPFDLAAGDVLYLPGGTEHAATATAGPSLHITLGFLRVTYRQVLRRALADLDGDLDDPLPLGYARGDGDGPDRLADGVATRFAETARHLEKADAAEVA